MSEWIRTLNRFRDGAVSRDELLASVDALIVDGVEGSDLSASLLDENFRNPLPAGIVEAVEDRIRILQDRTRRQPRRRDRDVTQLMDRSQDETQLLVDDGLDVESWRAPIAVNAMLAGRFKLVQLIGEGGMSEVYKAIDLRKVEAGARDPHLAVKVLTVRFDDYFSSLSVMHHEASKLQTLTHPNIVRVIDCDRDGQTVFMTMEYLDGIPLRLRLQKNGPGEGLPREEALRIVASIAAALDFAHRKHIVHGDLKPGNVILTTSDEVKVIDFGIARFLRRTQEEEETPSEEWSDDFRALTPVYASPEMIEGAEADPRDDVYALACITYEMLTGAHPFARAAATTARDTGLQPAPSKQLRAQEFRAIQNGLQFDRNERTASAQDFLAQITGVRMRSMRQVAMWVGVAVVALGAAIFAGRAMRSNLATDSAQARLTTGTVFRDCPTCPLMLVLAPATFEQGSPAGSPGSLSFEQPAHAVTIGYSLAAGVYETTVGEFSEFVRENQQELKGCATYDGEWRLHSDVSWRNAVQGQMSSHPVACVSWQDATNYAAWLSKRAGVTYRLPSASEWEYMARAGSAALPWRKPADACANANAADASAAQRYPGWTTFECSDNYVQTAPVGTFVPNAFGVSDTLGNVFEWVQDCWRDDYTLAPHDGSAVMDGDCGQREARGGSWFTTPAFVRPAYRNRFDATYRSSSLGFRLVREVKNER